MNTPVPTPTPQPRLDVSTQAWKDCALAPGWIACDPAQAAVDAKVALASTDGKGIVTINLSNPDAWQANIAPQSLDWSPQGDQLLISLGNDEYGVMSAQGEAGEKITGKIAPRWQLNNLLGKEGRIFASDGSQAWLESTSDGRWNLHVVMLGGSEQIYPVAAQSTDQVYHLVSWVPGTTLVLAQVYYASNAAMIEGGSLFLIDASTGKQSEFGEGTKSKAPLGNRAVFRWNPQAAVLAYIDTGVDETTRQVLGLKNFKTGQLQFPLPSGVVITGLAWSPDGENLIFSAYPVDVLQNNEVAKILTLPGIYSMKMSTDKVTLLTQPPKGAQDVSPYFTADGKILLYARLFESGKAELHALQLSDQKDWVILKGWNEPCAVRDFYCSMQSWLAITSP